MLVDLSEDDIARGRDLKDDAEPSLFVDSYERVSKGIYKTNFLFMILGGELFSDEDPFESWQREFWQAIRKFDDDPDSPELAALRENYWTRCKDTTMPKTSYGVCDFPEQIVDKFPGLLVSPHRFIIMVNEVRKEDQSSEGGWRWHKWGEYIGNKESQCEYLFDEGDDIESVFTYEIRTLRN